MGTLGKRVTVILDGYTMEGMLNSCSIDNYDGYTSRNLEIQVVEEPKKHVSGTVPAKTLTVRTEINSYEEMNIPFYELDNMIERQFARQFADKLAQERAYTVLQSRDYQRGVTVMEAQLTIVDPMEYEQLRREVKDLRESCFQHMKEIRQLRYERYELEDLREKAAELEEIKRILNK